MSGTGAVRYLRPAAALVRPDRLVRGLVCCVADGRIEAWLRAADLPAGATLEDHPGELWTAAPWMLHAHLESHDAPQEAWPRASFAAWAAALLAWRQQPERLTPAASAAASLDELGAHGCGLVVASVSEPEASGAAAAAAAPDQRPQCLDWPELLAPDPAAAAEVWATQTAALGDGLALHAPYTVSQQLAQRAVAWVQASPRRRLSIHLGEHAEEREFLRDGSGPLAQLLRARGRTADSPHWDSPVAWLDEAAPGRQVQLFAVHGGDLTTDELRCLQRKAVRLVWCPGTHRYFDRPGPRFAEAGLPAPLLGCDSRASNARLDPFAELLAAREELPAYSAQAWWAAVTTRAAAALGRAADGGSLEPGRRARPLRLPDPDLHEPAALCDSLLSAAGPRPIAPPGLPAPCPTPSP